MKKFVKTIACVLLALSFVGVPSALMGTDSSSTVSVSANSGDVYIFQRMEYGKPGSDGTYNIWKVYTVYSYGRKKPDLYKYVGTGKIR